MIRFLVHRHTAGRRHYDLRIIQDEHARSWSMLKEPPIRPKDRRLAIEREEMPVEKLHQPKIEEEAFGIGRVQIWDQGEATIIVAEPRRLVLAFTGERLKGRYELRRMRWYPGNRWLLEKSGLSDANLT